MPTSKRLPVRFGQQQQARARVKPELALLRLLDQLVQSPTGLLLAVLFHNGNPVTRHANTYHISVMLYHGFVKVNCQLGAIGYVDTGGMDC